MLCSVEWKDNPTPLCFRFGATLETHTFVESEWLGGGGTRNGSSVATPFEAYEGMYRVIIDLIPDESFSYRTGADSL